MSRITHQVTVIAAGAGFNLIVPVYDNGVILDIDRSPVLAWSIDTKIERFDDGNQNAGTNNVFPITLDYLSPAGYWAIEYPDGKFTIADERSFSNATLLIAYWNIDIAAKERSELPIKS